MCICSQDTLLLPTSNLLCLTYWGDAALAPAMQFNTCSIKNIRAFLCEYNKYLPNSRITK